MWGSSDATYDCKYLAVIPVTHVDYWSTKWSISIFGSCNSVKSIKLDADFLTEIRSSRFTKLLLNERGGTFNLIVRTESGEDDIFTLSVLN